MDEEGFLLSSMTVAFVSTWNALKICKTDEKNSQTLEQMGKNPAWLLRNQVVRHALLREKKPLKITYPEEESGPKHCCFLWPPSSVHQWESMFRSQKDYMAAAGNREHSPAFLTHAAWVRARSVSQNHCRLQPLCNSPSNLPVLQPAPLNGSTWGWILTAWNNR